ARRARRRAEPGRARRLPSPAGPGEHDDHLDLLGLREDVLAQDLPDEIRVIDGQVGLRLLPELVVVFALDDLAAHAVDSLEPPAVLHGGMVGGAEPAVLTSPASRARP